jgi:hypothetical protein
LKLRLKERQRIGFPCLHFDADPEPHPTNKFETIVFPKLVGNIVLMDCGVVEVALGGKAV